MANVRKVNNKKGVSFKIRISCGYDENGKKITKTTTYTPDQSLSARQQKKDADKYALDLENKIKKGICCDGGKTLFEKFANDWLKQKKDEISYNSYKSYEMMLRTKIIPYFKFYKLENISLEMVEAFYQTLAKDSAQGSIQKYAMLLSSIFKTALRRRKIEINPCAGAIVSKSKKRTGGIKFFTPEQAKAFLTSLDMEFELTYKGHERIDDTGKAYYVNEYIERRGLPTQFKVFLNIAMTCGMRKGEILALTWDDINLEKKMISVRKSVTKAEKGVAIKEPKTISSVRQVLMPEEIIPLLRQYRSEYNQLKVSLGDKWQGEGNVFTQANGKLMGIHTPYQRFVSQIEKYNEWVEQVNATLPNGVKKLEQLPKIPFHGLRHTCATLLTDKGTNILAISKMLGHAQTSTTMNIYAHSFESQLREASNNMNDFLRKCGETTDEQRAAI